MLPPERHSGSKPDPLVHLREVMMGHRDNWGWQARIGMFIVSSEAVPEAEWWAMLPPDVSVHAARVTASTPWAGWDPEQNAVQLQEDLARGARQFAAMRLSAVVLGHSSSSIVGGKGWDEAVMEQLCAILPAEIEVTTNGLDCVAALQASDVHHPFLVFPPWFNDTTLGLGTAYFQAQGFDPAGAMRHDPGRGWRDIPPGELYANGAGFAQDVEALYAQIKAACPASADGVLIAGTGFRCVGIIDSLERDLGKPVITANQASLWRCLRLSGVRESVSGYGQLLSL
jgi:maleate isomerase